MLGWMASLLEAVDDSESKMVREAAEFFDAKRYDQSLENYRKPLAGRLEGWQKAVIIYDIGTVLLAQGKWQEAISQFNTIEQGANNSPLLLRRLYTNKALAYFQMAKSLGEKSKSLSIKKAIF